MALEVAVEKRLAAFTLSASFAAQNETLAILGPSGSGKSMLLRMIAGLERPDRGRIALNRRVLFDSGARVNLPARERRIGMLFQHYALFPHRTLEQNAAFALAHLPAAERRARVREQLERLHLAELAGRLPRELSGGEQQRAGLARALASEPEALLLDEPLSALDTHLRSQMESLLQQTFAAYRRPSLLVTHNMEEAYRLGQRLLVLSRGRVIALSEKEQVFRRPPTVECARLTGCKNFSRARAAGANTIQALDWGCELRVDAPQIAAAAHLGIRAHHIAFPDTMPPAEPSAENTFPCWLARSSESPFRVTLFLKLQAPPGSDGEYHLQAEIFKEKWERLRARPLPWPVQLPASALMVFAD